MNTIRAYSALFNSDDGKIVLHDLINTTGMLGSSLDLKHPNQLVSAFNDGAKSILHRIITQISMDPEQYVKLLTEHQEEEDAHGFNE